MAHAPLTVAYVGNFGPRHSTENHVKLSLEELGHTVVPLQEDQLHAGTLNGSIGWPQVAEHVAGIDGDVVLLWTRTWQHERPEEQHAALEALRALGIPSASYHLDLYLGLDREEQVGREAFWHTDVVCTADGALPDEDWWTQHGVRHRWVRPGVLAAECIPGTYQPTMAADVAFVGSWRRYHSEWPYRSQLVGFLQRTYGRRFRKWPEQGRPAVRNEALNDLYASTKVVVGDSLCLGFNRPRYWSDRVYETVGRGGFLVMPYIDGLGDEFTDGEHLRYYTFGDFGELKALVDYYTDPAHDDERRALAAAGQAHVRETATYTHRVAEVLAHIQEVRPVMHERPPRPAVPRPMFNASALGTGAWFEPRPGDIGDIDVEVVGEVWRNDYRVKREHVAGGTVLDVGANIGAFTVMAAKLGASVVAVEPHPANRERLERHLNINDVGAQVHVVPLAVGPVAGEHLTMVGDGGGAHLGDGDIKVETTTLDDLVAQHGPIRFLKMDVEGAEYAAFHTVSDRTMLAIERMALEVHGPVMPHLAHLDEDGGHLMRWGQLLAQLAAFGHLELTARPMWGGLIHWRRF